MSYLRGDSTVGTCGVSVENCKSLARSVMECSPFTSANAMHFVECACRFSHLKENQPGPSSVLSLLTNTGSMLLLISSLRMQDFFCYIWRLVSLYSAAPSPQLGQWEHVMLWVSLSVDNFLDWCTAICLKLQSRSLIPPRMHRSHLVLGSECKPPYYMFLANLVNICRLSNWVLILVHSTCWMK